MLCLAVGHKAVVCPCYVPVWQGRLCRVLLKKGGKYAEIMNHISDNPMQFKICATLTQIGNGWVHNIIKINRFQCPFRSQIFPLFPNWDHHQGKVTGLCVVTKCWLNYDWSKKCMFFVRCLSIRCRDCVVTTLILNSVNPPPFLLIPDSFRGTSRNRRGRKSPKWNCRSPFMVWRY